MSTKINGLGVIKFPEMGPAAKAAVSLPVAALGAFSAYHVWATVPRVSSGIGKFGVGAGGALLVFLTVESLICGIKSTIEALAPEKPKVVPVEMPAAPPLKGLGYFNPTRQPDMMHAQTHWLDRRWPDRYEYWWEPVYRPETVEEMI